MRIFHVCNRRILTEVCLPVVLGEAMNGGVGGKMPKLFVGRNVGYLQVGRRTTARPTPPQSATYYALRRLTKDRFWTIGTIDRANSGTALF